MWDDRCVLGVQSLALKFLINMRRAPVTQHTNTMG